MSYLPEIGILLQDRLVGIIALKEIGTCSVLEYEELIVWSHGTCPLKLVGFLSYHEIELSVPLCEGIFNPIMQKQFSGTHL